MANLKNVIYLSNEDYETLVSTGTVTIDGETLTYDENNIYITPDKLVTTTEDGLMSCTDKVILNTINSAYIKNASVSNNTLTLTKQDGTTVTYTPSFTDNNYYHTPSYSSGLKIATGTGVNDLYVPTGNTASSVCVGNDSRLSDARTPTSHTHGNIQNGGTITSTAVTAASGIVVVDSSNAIQKVTNMSSFRSIIGAGTGNGDVTGPSSSTTNHVATFSDGNGKTIKDSGATLTSTTLILKDSGSTNVTLDTTMTAYATISKSFVPGYNNISGGRDNALDLGYSGFRWKDLYLAGSLKDGTNSITVAQITAKSDASNIQNGTGTSALQQKQDGTSGTFDFTGKNPNATALDSSLTGNLIYGGVGNYSASFGGKSQASGKRSVAQGTTTVAKGNYSHAEGDNSVSLGADSHAEGYQTVSYGGASHAEGTSTQALGNNSHAEGNSTIARAVNSHAEGYNSQTLISDSSRPNIPAYSDQQGGGGSGPGQGGTSTAQTGDGAHVEGSNTRAVGNYSHAEGTNTWAGGLSSHAEGYGSQALYDYAHAEGYNSVASGYGAHATGLHTVAAGNYSFTQGQQTEAGYNLSSAFGKGTQTHFEAETVVGKYNSQYYKMGGTSLFAVGNGTADNARSNAFVVYADGSAEVSGKTVATTDQIPNDSNLVHKTGTETISGQKTFTSDITLTTSPYNAQPGVSFINGSTTNSIYSDNGNLKVAKTANGSTTTLTFPAATGTLATTADVSSALRPTLVGQTNTVSNVNGSGHTGAVFSLGSGLVNRYSLLFFTYGNCMIMIPAYGLNNGTEYKTAAALVDSGGNFKTAVLTYKIDSSNKLTIYNKQDIIPTGYGAALYKIRLYV